MTLTNDLKGIEIMTTSSARVLIVDDEPISRKMVQFALELHGFECDLAEDGLAAQQHLAQHHYDVVVTDLLMPRVNGGELVISLCARPWRPIVVVHSAVLEREVSRGLKREGVDEIFYKPTDYTKMAEKIQSLVASRRSRQPWRGRWDKWRRASAPTESHNAIRLFVTGNEWIQSRPARREAFRFGIIVLACILFGLGWGHSLTPQMAGVCMMFGLCGLAFYFSLELVAYYRDQNRATLLRYYAEQRLSKERSLRTESTKAPLDDIPLHRVLA